MTTSLCEPPAIRAPPLQQRDYLSFSAIRLYQQCPLRYFFRYVAGLPEESVSASLVFGSAIHRAVEYHFRRLLQGDAAPTPDELVREYQAHWEENGSQVRFGKEESIDSLDALAAKMLQAFCTSDVAYPQGQILAVEETLRGGIIPGLPDLLGRVDLIVETPQELVISDWKTSRARYSTEQVQDAAEQLLLYSELAHDFAPGKTVRIEFAVLTKTKEVAIDRHSLLADAARADRIKRVVERVWQAIEAQHFYPAPSPTSCPGCPFREPCQKWPG